MTIAASRVNPFFQQTINAEAQQPSSRRPRAAETGPTEAGAQAKGNSELAELFAQVLRTAQSTGTFNDIQNIPPASAFGQWWSHLHNAMKNPLFVGWATEKGIDRTKSIEINHKENSITALVGGKRRVFSGSTEGYGWASMMEPILQAAKALTSASPYIIYSPATPTSASYRAVADFYGEGRGGFNREGAGARAAELEQTKTFDLAEPAARRSEDNLQHEKTRLADIHDQWQITLKLVDVMLRAEDESEKLMRRTKLPPYHHLYLTPTLVNARLEHFIRNQLSNTTITLHADSPHRQWEEDATVSLEKYIGDNAWDMPKSRDDLYSLGQFLTTAPLSQPPLGNLGGALSWPTPWSDDDRRNVKNALRQNTLGISGLDNYDEPKGVLGYLTHQQDYAPYQLRNREQFIQTLLATPKAQALGLALQEKFEGVSTPNSINDWTLAALSATLDEESDDRSTSSPARTTVAGFDLARSEHWGKPPSATVTELAEHLVDTGRASAQMAPIAAHLLLAHRAPAYVVKEIPDTVTYGSHTWVSFSTAVARIEAQAPGSTARMTFAQVMMRNDIAPVTDQDRHVEQRAQWEALKDWGVANGITPLNPQDQYTDDQMRRVSSAFNHQVDTLSEASKTLSTPMPEREEMALAQLRRVYGNRIPFEEKCITTFPERRDYPGPYSVLDLYLKGYLHSRPAEIHDWESSGTKFHIRDIQANADQLPDINEQFKTAMSAYFPAIEKAIGAQVAHLINTMPIEGRKNIDQWKITPLSEYNITQSPFGQIVETKVPNTLLVKAELDGAEHVYEINLRTNTTRKRDELKGHPLGPQFYADGHSRRRTMLKAVEPAGSYSPNVTDKKHSTATPNSFTSEKTRYIAGAMIENVGIRELEHAAKGMTTFDTEVPFYKKVQEFMLNLIPLRSAIQNFQEGNIGDGIVDLAFDAFGFVLGVGAAAKAAKAVQAGVSLGRNIGAATRSGASLARKIAHGAKIIGRGAIGAINPLDGVVDLGVGAFRLGKAGLKGARNAFRKVTHAADAYDLVSASKRFDSSSFGTFKQGNNIVQGPAVLQDGKWFHYNPATRQPYGTALQDFVPSATSDTEMLAKWATADGIVKKVDEAVVNHWKKTVNTHRDGPGKAAFDRGYSTGNPETIKGFSNNIKAAGIMKLAADKNITAEQVGMLVRKYDDLSYELGRTGSARFIDNIEPRFGDVIPIPQVLYFSQTMQLSDGQCAALSRVMANAAAEGKEQILIKNMVLAAAFPAGPASRAFITKLSKLQTQVGARSAFHAGQPVRQLSVKSMVRELADSTVSKSVMIDSPGHAMAAGVKIDGTRKTYYFYDPNFGIANFSSAEAMEKGLEKLTRDKKLVPQYKTHSTDPNKLEFQVFNHADDWQQKNSVLGKDVKALYDAPILVQPPSVRSAERFIDNLLKQRLAQPGTPPSIKTLGELKSADFDIPPQIYRAHTAANDTAATGLRRAAGAIASGDDYLAAIIQHTARTGGSSGEVMSFSAKKAKAESFATMYSTEDTKVPVFTVDTTQDPGAFRTVADIILKDGERLIAQKKITKATLLQAIEKLHLQEAEVFYIKGDVPAAFIAG
ncbi:YopT-type cysteine protease domain-containing protein [Pseudomonas sp. 1912-s]|uniref:YopT-type cysteine protease domain-containing protein n=1 Tax=Pseudomonas sp. 1912-s TaxID=3033802 RepID=UPI0023DE6B91|nr:YopT-type cysteine protease domain-containing protein [Pseudomonas sp. 1912-s]MDF3203212.1 YopT-type cysteine protease domain-containing protein [Pseudomonas sp. 1912-s]